MVENLKKLVKDYWAGRISRESLFAQLPFRESIERIPLAMLKEGYAEKDAPTIELGLVFAYSLRLTRDVSSELYQEYKDIFVSLWKSDWHQRHEDLIMILDRMRDPDFVEIFAEATSIMLDYRAYDDEVRALARKGIHALGNIANEAAKEKLIEVSHSTHPGLRALALKQLHQISAR